MKTKFDMESLVRLLVDAGAAISAVYAKEDFESTLKKDRSPLTEADYASQEILMEGITRIAPGIPILSEEMQEVPYATRKDWELYFLIDPLDGTREFVQRIPEFSINVALIRRERPVLGIIHLPLDRVSYVAEEGSGTYRWEGKERRRLPLSYGDHALRILISRTEESPGMNQLLARIPGAIHRMGSSMKFCKVAEGSADFYPRLKPSMEWDTAAGTILIQEAGGRVTKTDGAELLYNRESLLNPPFFAMGKDFMDKVPLWKDLLLGSTVSEGSSPDLLRRL